MTQPRIRWPPKACKTDTIIRCRRSSAAIIGVAKHIAQYMDRDTRPDFASTVMIPSFQQFIGKPDDIDNLLKSIDDQKKSIFVG